MGWRVAYKLLVLDLACKFNLVAQKFTTVGFDNFVNGMRKKLESTTFPPHALLCQFTKVEEKHKLNVNAALWLCYNIAPGKNHKAAQTWLIEAKQEVVNCHPRQ